jgi:hypothetical protein
VSSAKAVVLTDGRVERIRGELSRASVGKLMRARPLASILGSRFVHAGRILLTTLTDDESSPDFASARPPRDSFSDLLRPGK